MTDWTKPKYSRGSVARAGVVITSSSDNGPELDRALEIVNNWRSSHAFPLNTIKMGLKKASKKIDGGATIAQRIKRLSSIKLKLTNEPTMQLSRMQDLGGCRAIVDSIESVNKLITHYKKLSKIKHKLANAKDYISSPKPSGYRGIHLVYRYYSDKNTTYNGLQIEIQIRTRLQHAWATAVETVGTFKAQSLKSSRGDADWLRFFQLMSSAIALIEKADLVPNTPKNEKKIILELSALVKKLNVISALETYSLALKIARDSEVAGQNYYYLLKLEPSRGQLSIKGYAQKDLAKAENEYLNIEKSLDPTQEAVLVSVESFTSLERAYPNYFLDTKQFIGLIKAVLGAPK